MINTNILDKESLMAFEKNVRSDREDLNKSTIDFSTTTVGGIIKKSIERDYKENYLKNIKIFKGIVCRLPSAFVDPSASTTDIIVSQQTSSRQYKYKVRIPEIDAPLIEMPQTFDGTPEDIDRINKLKDFDECEGISLSLGDVVFVEFNDSYDTSGGKIIGRIPQSPKNMAYVSENSLNLSAEDAFSGRTPEQLSQAGEMLSLGDAAKNNKNIGRIKVKPINTHKGEMQYLESRTADRFIQMREDAKKENINLHLNSGFRTRDEQERLYKLYLARKGNLASPPDAAPSAGHRAGDAADIQTGGFSTPIYLWLFRNAPKYDFYNNGRFFQQKENWHHQFAPPGSDAANMSSVQSAKKYHKNGIPYGGQSDNNDNRKAKKSQSSP